MSEKTVRLIALECPTCSVIYGVTEFYQQQRAKDHRGWKCPNGHGVWYPPQNESSESDKVDVWIAPKKRN